LIVAASLLGSLVMGLIYSFLTVTLRANQNVTGLALTTFGVGVGNFFGGSLIKLVDTDMPSIALTKTSAFFTMKLPFADSLGAVGEILFSHDFLTYLAIIIAVITSFVLNKTRVGLNLRSVGENPATADAAGINVTKYKYLATIIGGGISAIGGMVYIMTTAGCVWNHEGLSGVGWLAVALVIFCLWKPMNAIWGSILFGALMIMYLRVIILFIPTEIYKILPYVVTVIVLILSSMRNNKEKQPPASLGLNYFREDR
jgi:simple sugar transport system permease protein